MADYVLGIDQSTQGTKALLFNYKGKIICRTDLPHRQIINEKGWVEHDPEEIYRNIVQVVKNLVKEAGISKGEIRTIGISNQRETAMVWNRHTGNPVYNAIVWQCARGAAICGELADSAELVREVTGLQLSPYFSAAKIAWVLQNVKNVQECAEKGELFCGTMDSWLVYKLTGGKEFKTDYSNASRTQLFNIRTLRWDKKICKLFQIPMCCLAEVTDSDGFYGETDFEGYLDHPIPIHAVMGDSHGALFGQGCHMKGMLKATYGTGSSIMMNIGEIPVFSKKIVTSIAWCRGGRVYYVLEGNINYTGAVITWMKEEMGLIQSPSETELLAKKANPKDTTYMIPAFSGMGAPHWDNEAKAAFLGMTRTTGKAEIVKAGLESIAYQITDVVNAMQEESGIQIEEMKVDGGPTKNVYLMQFQSDIAQIPVLVPESEELSGIGVAYMAGIAEGIYDMKVLFEDVDRTKYNSNMAIDLRKQLYTGWKEALNKVINK